MFRIAMIWLLCVSSLLLSGQEQDSVAARLNFFEFSPTYHQGRLTSALVFAGTAYTAFSVGLYNSWYKNYPQGKFHLFNDAAEWNQMDKGGHVFSGYFQSLFCYRGARWTGISENKAITMGLLCGALFQSTIEVMDGFSTEWGFSLTDMAANTAGLAVFYAQQRLWQEQRITLKESTWPISYAAIPIMSTDGLYQTTLKSRTDKLFGKSGLTRALKDYNVQTYWASFNVHSLLGKGNGWPAWLNVAVGYGAGNLYGGFKNNWELDGISYDYPEAKRYRQFYLALDYDLRKLGMKNALLRTLCQVLNIYKFPAPALEYNTLEGFKLHLLIR
ncbi:MAG: DUF2279 domain-containing protein [Saprospiraceae bacterium]|nr:DUF2279 domain-containing protein [Saprospiraceae bacterium]